MKKFLLLALLLGLPSPLFAGDSTENYKQEKSCLFQIKNLVYGRKKMIIVKIGDLICAVLVLVFVYSYSWNLHLHY